MSCSQFPAHGKWHNSYMDAAKPAVSDPDLRGWLCDGDLGHALRNTTENNQQGYGEQQASCFTLTLSETHHVVHMSPFLPPRDKY